jgi:hypothetical protein
VTAQLLKLGPQAIQLQVSGRYYAEGPQYGVPTGDPRFTLTFLFPK